MYKLGFPFELFSTAGGHRNRTRATQASPPYSTPPPPLRERGLRFLSVLRASHCRSLSPPAGGHKGPHATSSPPPPLRDCPFRFLLFVREPRCWLSSSRVSGGNHPPIISSNTEANSASILNANHCNESMI